MPLIKDARTGGSEADRQYFDDNLDGQLPQFLEFPPSTLAAEDATRVFARLPEQGLWGDVYDDAA